MNVPHKMPDWVYNQMIEGLQKLMVLRLQGAPPADTVNALAAVWEEALTPHTWAFEQEADRQRLPAAFGLLIRQTDKWVQPAQLIKLIPPRSEPYLAGLLTAKRDPLTDEQRAEHQQRMEQIYTRLAQAKALQTVKKGSSK